MKGIVFFSRNAINVNERYSIFFAKTTLDQTYDLWTMLIYS